MTMLNDAGALPTARKEFVDFAQFAVETRTTGPRGGDAGHGSRVELTFENLGATAWEVEVDGVLIADHPRSVTLRFGGDSEGANLVDGLEFALRELAAAWRPAS